MRCLSLAVILFVCPVAWADQVCLVKATNTLLEHQSRATPGTCLKNAQAAGFAVDEVEEREVSAEEWALMREALIVKPARDQAKAEATARQQKAEAVRQKLGLSAAEFRDLKDALR